jgi:light-regulated signal transduction histidine kinase (bacteriophytochrome)
MIGSVSLEIAERNRVEERLQRRALELEQSNKQLEQFAHVVSHDLQEPLRTISSHLRLLAHRQEGEFDQDAKESVTVALDGINRMYRQIDNLLANSRVDSDGKTEETTE